MANQQWQSAIAYAAVAVVLGLTYFTAQRAVDAHRAVLPIQAYLECLEKMATFDWSRVPAPKPSASEVCQNLSSRR